MIYDVFVIIHICNTFSLECIFLVTWSFKLLAEKRVVLSLAFHMAITPIA